MSFTTFLLTLVGRNPDQLEEQRRFNSNLNKQDKVVKELDSLLVEIRAVDQAVKEKSTVVGRAAQNITIPPLPPDTEEEGYDRQQEQGSRQSGEYPASSAGPPAH